MKYLLVFLVFSLSMTLQADPLRTIEQGRLAPTTKSTTAQAMPQGTDVIPKLLEVTFGLLMILALIGVIAWSVRRFGRLHIAAKGHLKIIGGMHLGTRERLVLVQVGDKQLLIGVTPGRIDNLLMLDEPIPLDEETHNKEESFYYKLSTLMRTK